MEAVALLLDFPYGFCGHVVRGYDIRSDVKVRVVKQPRGNWELEMILFPSSMLNGI